MEIKAEELGLSSNEFKIYEFILRRGETTTGPIIKETRIANSRVYESINSLITKGLVSYAIKKDGKHFTAENPNKFLEIEDERKQKLEQIVPQLVSLQNTSSSETTSAIYEGFEGFKTAFKKIIEDCPANETICILGFSEQQFATKSLRTFLSNMNLKSAKKRQKLKILLDVSARKTLGRDREKETYSEVRYMPERYVSPAAIDVFDDYVYIFLWEEKPYVFSIKNKKIAESFKKYFQFLWTIAKK